MAIFSNPKSLLSITGVNAFVGDVIRHVTTVDDQLDRVCETFARRIEKDAKANAPYDPRRREGTHLRDAITARRKERSEWLIGPEIPPAMHAHLVEYGVPSRGIAPTWFMRRAFEKHQEGFVNGCTKIAGSF